MALTSSRGAGRADGPAPASTATPAAILFDRDGTLIEDVPALRDPGEVRPSPRAQEAVRYARSRGVRLGVVTNQPVVASGAVSRADLDRVHRRIDDLFGAFDVWCVCPHAAAEGCACRKPAPGLVRQAAEALGVPVDRTAVIGDIGADVLAARAAGAAAVLVPTPVTRQEEVEAADVVAADLLEAVLLLLDRDGSD